MTSRSFLFKQKIPCTQLIEDEVESAREMYRAMLIDSSLYEYCFPVQTEYFYYSADFRLNIFLWRMRWGINYKCLFSILKSNMTHIISSEMLLASNLWLVVFLLVFLASFAKRESLFQSIIVFYLQISNAPNHILFKISASGLFLNYS